MRIPASLRARTRAAVEMERLRQFLDERDRNYLPKRLVANAFVGIGHLLRSRLQAVPLRLAETLKTATEGEARRALRAEVDDILVELGDAAERELRELLEGEES